VSQLMFFFLQILHLVRLFKFKIRGSGLITIKFHVFVGVEPSSYVDRRVHQGVGIYVPHHTALRSP
jgi:hypothetical protein